MKTCIYCNEGRDEKEFSHEHIWPDALGGDYLSGFWRTEDVCQKCNSLSGVFVDGSFIRSWAGAAERATGAYDYLDVNHPEKGVVPLNFIGRLPDLPVVDDEVAEYWAGPCGANIVHFRPGDKDDIWTSYAGGDPRTTGKRTKAGRAYMALTSDNPFWIFVSLASFKAHFRKAELFITNMELPAAWSSFKTPELSDPVQARDMSAVSIVVDAGKSGSWIKTQTVFRLDLGNRLLAKLALAIGYKTFGAPFLATAYATLLRQGFREANADKRRSIPVRGTGYLNDHGLGGVVPAMKWPGAWVLILKASGVTLGLSVVTPSGSTMHVVVSEDFSTLGQIGHTYAEGKVWLTIPSLGEAIGPIPLPAYIAHQANSVSVPELAALAAKRIDPSTLPQC